MNQIETVAMWKDGLMLTANVKKLEVPQIVSDYLARGWFAKDMGHYFVVESPEYTKEMQKIAERRARREARKNNH